MSIEADPVVVFIVTVDIYNMNAIGQVGREQLAVEISSNSHSDAIEEAFELAARIVSERDHIPAHMVDLSLAGIRRVPACSPVLSGSPILPVPSDESGKAPVAELPVLPAPSVAPDAGIVAHAHHRHPTIERTARAQGPRVRRLRAPRVDAGRPRPMLDVTPTSTSAPVA